MPIPHRPLPLFLLTLLALSACGGDAESAEADAPPAARTLRPGTQPWDTLPPERLYGASPAENLRVTPVELELPTLPQGVDSLRLAVLSDLQLGLWDENAVVARTAVQRAVAADPDAVVLLGDFLARGDDPSALRRVLAPLRNVPAFAVLGDRDIRSDTVRARVERTLREAGVRVLSNETAALQVRGRTVPIGGIDPELLDETGADQEWVIANLGGGGVVPVLLTHAPGLAQRAPEGGAPVILAGGVVCSDVEVPGSPRLSLLRDQVLPGAGVEGAERLFVIDRNVLFVTCGTGYGFLPARAVAPPEVALVTLRRPGTDAAPADTAATAADSLLRQFEAGDTGAAGAAN